MSSSNQESSVAGAIDYPASNEQPVPVQPRQPRNLQGLLRFAMEATKAEDAPGPSTLGPMDEERKRFLEEAMKMMSVDVAEMLQNAIKVLSDETVMNSIQEDDDLPEEVNSMLNVIIQFVDDIDIANDFSKLGGFSIFPVCFGCKHTDVRARASVILGTMCQNNPECQARALNYFLLNVLINLANEEIDKNSQGILLGKYLYGISGIVRGYEPAMTEILEQDGCKMLMNVLNSSNSPAKARVAFVIQHLCHNDAIKEYFVNQKIVRVIANHLTSESATESQITENYLALLQTLVEGFPAALMEQCRDPDLNIKAILENHIALAEKDEMLTEEAEYCKSILNQIEQSLHYDDLNDEVDR